MSTNGAEAPPPLPARPVGAHLPHTRGLLAIPNRAREIGATGVQIFTDNPTAWKRRAALPPDVAEFRARMAALDVGPLCVHAPYLVNLAGRDRVLHRRSTALLLHELNVAREYGAAYVNVHVGSHRGAGPEAGTARVADALERTLDEAQDGAGAPLLVLENGAGGGDCLGTTVDELAAILDAAAHRPGFEVGRLAFCLDAAHLWAAGYDVGDPAVVDALVEEFEAKIGLDRLAIVHLNDSYTAQGSRHDRHAHLGEGTIGTAGLSRLLRHPRLAHAAFYLETPGMDRGYDAVNVARAMDLAAGRPLSDLSNAVTTRETAG